jgi:microcystin degradation protein MlrC
MPIESRLCPESGEGGHSTCCHSALLAKRAPSANAASLTQTKLQKRFVMLQSRIHWRSGLAAMAKAVVECAGMGVCTSDYSQLTFENVRRPIYPLDLPNR